MTTAPFPLQLEQIIFTHVEVVAIPEHVPPTDQKTPLLPGPQNQLDVQASVNDPKQWSATMTTVLNPEKTTDFPYSLHLECTALFRVLDETLTPPETHRGVTITGHNVLFGAIRETVAWVTSRQPYGPFIFGLSVLVPMSPDSQTAETPPPAN